MKMSEAMRLGAMMAPQAYGDLEATSVTEIRDRRWYHRLLGLKGRVVGRRGTTGTCALGAAFAAGNCRRVITGSPGGYAFRGEMPKTGVLRETIVVPSDWSDLLFSEYPCPQCGRLDVLGRILPHLNDDHRWTREASADFVDGIERARAEVSQPSEAEA